MLITLPLRTIITRTSKMNKCADMLSFFSIVGKLKSTQRAGWVRKGVKDPESVGDHMYRMSIMAMTLCGNELKKDHCIKLCLVHDMAESIVGDYTPSDGISVEQKHKEELAAMVHLGGFVGEENAEDLKKLFMEYEEQKTPESHFVKDLDKFDMILQAFEYENEAEKPGWLQEFFDSTEGKFKTETVKNMVKALKEQRSSSIDSKQLPSETG